jgi:hypothetical protein
MLLKWIYVGIALNFLVIFDFENFMEIRQVILLHCSTLIN